jgi:hypothetical protein
MQLVSERPSLRNSLHNIWASSVSPVVSSSYSIASYCFTWYRIVWHHIVALRIPIVSLRLLLVKWHCNSRASTSSSSWASSPISRLVRHAGGNSRPILIPTCRVVGSVSGYFRIKLLFLEVVYCCTVLGLTCCWCVLEWQRDSLYRLYGLIC